MHTCSAEKFNYAFLMDEHNNFPASVANTDLKSQHLDDASASVADQVSVSITVDRKRKNSRTIGLHIPA